MLNSINLVGRLTNDPQLKESANSETGWVNFSIAVDNTRLEADGTRGTCFLDAIAFGNQAKAIARSLHKGSKVAISGSLNQRNFIRQDGSKGRAYEINVDSVEFLDPKPVSEPCEAVEAAPVQEEPLYDPHTGKPLKPQAKK